MNKPSYTLNPYVISKSFSFYLRSFEVTQRSILKKPATQSIKNYKV